MKNILCFGDSNTFGYDPAGDATGISARFAWDVRWTGLVQRELGSGAHIIEEGLCGRTSMLDDPCSPGRNGFAALPGVLETHQPLDIVVLMLGTNDLKSRFGLSPRDIARGIQADVRAIRSFTWANGCSAPQILVVCPPEILPVAALAPVGSYDEASVERSHELAPQYRAVADKCGTEFFDASAVVRPGGVDGIHLDAVGHAAFAQALAPKLREMLA